MAFREAKAAKIGGKFLVYGMEGSGKSMFQLTFPNIACIDSEVGVAHYEGREINLNNGKSYNNLKLVDNTSDLDELESDLDDFLSGKYDDKINTLSIDSETKFYNTMQIAATEVEERKARKKGGDIDDTVVSQRQWGRIKIINMKFQQAKIDLSAKGIHVVSIAQATEVKNEAGDKVIGIKPDMHKSVKFDYDTILEFYKEEKNDDVRYFAKVKKDRTEVTKVGQIIENPTYDIWADYYNKKNGLAVNPTSYRKNLDTSIESMVDDSDKAEKVVVEWKKEMKLLNESKNANAIKKINKYLTDNNIEIKNIANYDYKTLDELLSYTRLVSE